MSIFSLFFSTSPRWDVSSSFVPWDKTRPSIYEFVREQGLQYKKDRITDLPDDDEFQKGKELRWAPGAQDGVFTHHARASDQKRLADTIFNTLKAAVGKSTQRAIIEYYQLLLQDGALGFIDPLLSIIAASKIDFAKVRAIAEWLATKSPDRDPVKVAIAMLGIFRDDQYKDIFLTLGFHDEFTLYCVVSLQNSLEHSEPVIWQLAKQVHGWGRIQAVERLTKTENAEIKRWMLREGYKNEIMDEYLAYTCATTGELLSELKNPSPDKPLLVGAGDIIEALISGGPAEEMADYAAGAEVVKLYIDHLSREADLSLDQFRIIQSIEHFVADSDKLWSELASKGWTIELRNHIREAAKAIIDRADWKEKAISGLSQDDYRAFHQAASVAESLGIDTWPHYFERQKRGIGDEWLYLIQTSDQQRIDQVVALAESIIPLDKIATGPALEVGVGKDLIFDFFIHGLAPFPGKGWKIVKAALMCPVIGIRRSAVKTLNAWGKDKWPNDAEKVLQAALDIEPDNNVKSSMLETLKGVSLG